MSGAGRRKYDAPEARLGRIRPTVSGAESNKRILASQNNRIGSTVGIMNSFSALYQKTMEGAAISSWPCVPWMMVPACLPHAVISDSARDRRLAKRSLVEVARVHFRFIAIMIKNK